MRVPDLHTAPKRHLIKIRTFLKKIDSWIWKNINLQDVLKGLDSTIFLEILHSNKTSNKFSNHQLKIAFNHPNFVHQPFQICLKIRTPLDSKHLNFRIFSSILHHKYPNNIC